MEQESFSRLHRRTPQQTPITTRKASMLSLAPSLWMIGSGYKSDSLLCVRDRGQDAKLR